MESGKVYVVAIELPVMMALAVGEGEDIGKVVAMAMGDLDIDPTSKVGEYLYGLLLEAIKEGLAKEQEM